LLKDDNLGLGAKRGNADGDTFGLDGLQTLLGRLNGKSESVLQKEEEARRGVKLAMYRERRFGTLRFISGGFLEGDNVEQAAHKDAKGSETNASSDVDPASRKRKRKTIEQLDSPPNSVHAADASRKKPKSKRSGDVQQAARKDGERRTKHASLELNLNTEEKHQRGVVPAQTPPAAQKREAASDTIDTKVGRRRRKAQKDASKETKRLRAVKDPDKQVEAEIPADEAATLKTAVESDLDGSSQEVAHYIKPSNAHIPAKGRHLVRQRYIQQKQMSSMDEQALREVSISRFRRTHSYADVIGLDFHD